ncbi:hypothetical protein QBC44DRAFT_336131 [Cladorrhinum sp. PSN332]|nr:hypothetical protein QBC44DRAFT_336131 [Cladorrhinum sp. PSN332]
MDNKRKAGSSAGVADNDDRAVKRRKAPGPFTDYDLMKGESPESTTAYGLHFLETIRRTKDKSGRLVASYFENLLPREKNKEYYDRIKMPISLSKIEHKLHNQDFANMSELESYFKRMVTNAKEFYPKHSQVFEDAERVRKALSNYMTKNNPAYKLVSGYSAVAAPIPDEADTDLDRFIGNGHADGGAGEEDDAEVEDDAEGEDDDAEGEEDEDENEKEDDKEQDEDEDEDDEDEEDEHPRRIVLKRKGGSGRPSRGTPARARKVDRNGRAKADHEYEDVPYKGLSFQQAQEKIVEELIRKPDGLDPYYIDFINLPARTNKGYFALIQNPLSLKGLQKKIKGIHGRKPATGVSEFKSWAAFEDMASLLWDNAHFFNEPISEIYARATELKKAFYEELAEAKAVVQEPPQAPKIKLRVAQDTPTPGPTAKKITIHVGRGSASGSPAPNQSSEGLDVRAPTTAASFQLDKTQSVSASVAPPSPSVFVSQTATGVQPSPGIPPQQNGNTPTHMTNGGPAPANGLQGNAAAPYQNGYPPAPVVIAAPPPPPPLWDNKYRAPGRTAADSLLPTVLIRTHPTIPMDRRFRVEIQANAEEAQQNVALQIPGNHPRLQLIPRLNPQLEQQGRQHKFYVHVNGMLVHRATPLPIPDDPLPRDAMVFDLGLSLGTNIIAITVVASLPKGQKLTNGADSEVEKLTIYANLTRVF